MGVSLLVVANKTDISGCMTVDEIGKVKDQYSAHPGRRTAKAFRDCNSTQSRRINGPSSDVAQSQESICRQDWHG